MGSVPHEIWVGVIGSLLASIITAVVSRMESRFPILYRPWIRPIGYGLAVGLAVMNIWTAWVLIAQLQPTKSVTADTAEAQLGEWLKTTRFNVRQTENSDAYFEYVVTTDSGCLVTVSRPKRLANYLEFSSVLQLSPEHRERFKKLNADQTRIFASNVILAVAPLGLSFSLLLPGQMRFHLEVPIGPTLTEFAVISAIHDTATTCIIARESVVRQMDYDMGLPPRAVSAK